jgi:hypothetical protein
MSLDSIEIQLSASRGIVDHFFCFTCDEYVWDCDDLIEARLASAEVSALERSELQSFAYDGRVRVLEIEFRVTCPRPPCVIQYRDVSRYIFSKLTR